ncbi:PepSY-associated TM helix domain-containing protein [Chitinophaga vietnamensis]|uniref:PepSY-associated TM helix domain-containing protein n=1 Tax=Chitinophaga vietnamensis TaxID=2593957 RepID=UPI0011775B3C|nr:PepSY-associated TM helix domain-containing protein [Chitinophaga vietnamensis]
MINSKEKPAKKRNRSWWQAMAAQLHLWLGLASGIIVLIVSVTGCLFVFQKEINEMVYHREMYVSPQPKPVLPLTELLAKAQAALGPDRPIRGVTAWRAPDKAWEFSTYKSNDTALTYFGGIEYYQAAMLNPYTGEVTGVLDYKHNFFSIVKGMHWSLLLNTPYGQPIVGWGTFIFVILLLTGLVLWWPKKWNKANREKSFRIKWKAGFKRVNYDLHNVLGFYTLLVALVIALTGMVWAFSWFQATVYVVASGSTTPPVVAKVASVKQEAPAGNKPLDIAFKAALSLLPDAKRFFVYPATFPEGVHTISGYNTNENYYGADQLQFDQYTGKLLGRRNDHHKNRGERLIDMNYDIHVGAIGGIIGKCIAFVVSLVCGSLPVTGFYVWWGKRKKSKKSTTTAKKIVQTAAL